MVTLPPHERLDKYTGAFQRLKNMALCQDHKNSAQFFSESDQKKCLWPMNHADKKSYKEKKSVRGMDILDQHGVRAAGLSILIRRQKVVNSKIDAEKSSDAKLLVVVNKLGVGLSDEVFSVEGKKVIEATRVILDLPTLAVKIKETRASPIKVAEVEFTKFAKAVSEISVNSVKGISEKEMKQQFRVFLERLSIMTEKIKEPELSKTDSKELIKQFFDPSNELFKDIEMIMECMVVSAVKHSFESVL